MRRKLRRCAGSATAKARLFKVAGVTAGGASQQGRWREKKKIAGAPTFDFNGRRN